MRLSLMNEVKTFFLISLKKQGRSHEDIKRKESVKALFTDETILRKGLLADAMYSETWSKIEARKSKVYYESHLQFTYLKALIIMNTNQNKTIFSWNIQCWLTYMTCERI